MQVIYCIPVNLTTLHRYHYHVRVIFANFPSFTPYIQVICYRTIQYLPSLLLKRVAFFL